jgi:hypothetical protein
MTRRYWLAFALIIVWTTPAFAQDLDDRLEGFGFGVALGVTWDTLTQDRVTDAIIDAAGIVRVVKRENVNARILLETHYFIPIGEQYGAGPFVSLQPGTEQIIEAIGVGFLFGLKRIGDNASLNLGAGWEVDPAVTILANEFVPGQRAPTGSDGSPLPLRYTTLAQSGPIFLTSFSWR